eukprot:gene2073-1945_t
MSEEVEKSKTIKVNEENIEMENKLLFEDDDEEIDLENTFEKENEIIEEITKTDSIPIEITNYGIMFKRCGWLIGLLILQSCSSWILSFFDDVLKKHFIVAIFLTMMIGTGGNAGSQSTSIFIRGLATKEINTKNQIIIFLREQLNGVFIGFLLAIVGFIRVVLFQWIEGNPVIWTEGFVISFSLFLIVITSVFVGSLLPLLLYQLNVDPVHASPTLQVL